MRKYLGALLLFCLTLGLRAQVNANADCINAIPLCNTPSFTFFATSGPGAIVDFSTSSSISNPINNPFPPDAGCLKSGELNPQWLLLTVGNAGILEFVFGAGNSPNPQAGCYDWSMWPYSPTTCQDIFNNTLAPIRCNWNATCNNGTGIASAANIAAIGGNAGDFGEPLPVNACQQFIICISNFSGVNTLVSFQSIGTASLSCNPNCNPNYTMCAGGAATIVPVNYAALSNPVYSIQPGGQSTSSGSFVVTPSVTTSYTTFITGLNSTNAVQTITSVSTVTVLSQPSAIPTLTQSTCTSSLTTIQLGLSFLPSAANYSITWSPLPNGISTAQQTSVSAYIPGGTYAATITATGGCSTTISFSVNPAPTIPAINLAPAVNNFTLTCLQPSITYTILDASNSYTWSNGLIAPINGQFAQMTYSCGGTWTITAVDPNSGCTTVKPLTISVFTTAPTSTIFPLFQNITCTLSSITTITAQASPSVNVSHEILAPQGGTFTANSYTTIYTPGGIGTYTGCAVNDVNGCKTCKEFTVSSNQGFPSFGLTSPQNFTLGCTTKSVAIINIVNGTGVPPGSPVSYTLIGPGTSTSTPSGTLSGQSTYTVNVPGSYTVITKDNTSFCETRVPVSILSNTFAPDISVDVPRQVLDCNFPKVRLLGQSQTNNISYNWSWPQNSSNLAGDSVTVRADFSVPNRSLVANYTLTVTDNSSTCRSTSIVPVYQNLFLPTVLISNGGTGTLTCKTPTITLTNQSSTGIQAGTGFSTDKPVQALIWKGPSPQEDLQLFTTYIAATPGVYTMTARDLNNGCTRDGTIQIGSNVIYPVITFTSEAVLDCGTGWALITPSLSFTPPGTTYTITPPPGGQVSPRVNSTGTFSSTSLGQHRLVAFNPANGCASSAIQRVVSGKLTAGLSADRTEGFAPLTVTFSNTSVTNSSNQGAQSSIKSIWNFANGTGTTLSTADQVLTVPFKAAGNYRVKMYAYSGSCMDTSSIQILVSLPSELEIPNIFTPNGDNRNDVFFIKGTSLKNVKLTVTDRWGHQVIEIEGKEGVVSWDGKDFGGKECADGIYFYILKANGLDGNDYDRQGNITLLR